MEQKKTVLIVEDEKNIVDIIRFNLQRTGYNTLEAYDGEAGLALAREKKPDLILLDIMLPGEDGISILRRLRSLPDTAAFPVILLTAKNTEYDKVIGLDSGADDYIAKPFGMMELVSRVRALLRRTAATPEKVRKFYQMGPVSVDVEKHEVLVDGNPVTLTYKEFELLCYLMENEGIVLSRDRLLSKIWGYDFDGETRTVDVHIRTLRQKLGIGGSIIETIRGVGYKADSCGKRE